MLALPGPELMKVDLETIEALAAESLCLRAPPEMAEALGVGVERIGNARLVTCRALAKGWMNRVVGLGAGEPATEAQVEAALAAFDRRGIENFFVQIAPGAVPAELEAWLEKRGLVRHSRSWTKFRRGPTPPPPERTTLRIAAIGPDHASAFANVVVTGYGMPAVLEPWFAALPGTPGWDVYVGFDDESAVAAAAMFSHSGVSWLGVATTLPSHRGRGAQSALLSRRVRDAIARDSQQITVETGEAVPGEPQTSYANILKSGFEVAYSRANFTRARAGGT